LGDLLKAAVWFALYGGTDPLLNNPEAITRFAQHQESFFDLSNISRFISFQATRSISSTQVTLPDRRRGFRIVRNVRVNVATLRAELERMGVISTREALAEVAGLPFIMVIPETPRGQTPLQVFDSNPLARQTAGVIESFLTARRFDVVVPRAVEQLNDLTNVQSQLRGAEEDISYQLALSLGADIYITFSGRVENDRANVVVRAYETTTARLLGTETGHSATRPGVSREVLVEEAVNGAIQNVLARIQAFWAEDARRGVQYKLIFNITGNFTDRQIQDLQFAVSDLIEDMFSSHREIIIADRTMDYIVWARNEEFSRSMNIFREIRQRLSGKADVTRININRKLIVLGLDNP